MDTFCSWQSSVLVVTEIPFSSAEYLIFLCAERSPESACGGSYLFTMLEYQFVFRVTMVKQKPVVSNGTFHKQGHPN